MLINPQLRVIVVLRYKICFRSGCSVRVSYVKSTSWVNYANEMCRLFLHQCIQNYNDFHVRPIQFVWEKFVFAPTAPYILLSLKVQCHSVSFGKLYKWNMWLFLRNFIWKQGQFLLTCTFAVGRICVHFNCSVHRLFVKSTLPCGKLFKWSVWIVLLLLLMFESYSQYLFAFQDFKIFLGFPKI